MKLNVGNWDRILRIIIAAAAGYFGFASVGVLSYVGFAVAAIMLITAIAGSCPLYTLFGITTCPVKKA